MKNNIKFDYVNNLIIVSKGYYAKAAIYGTDEHNEFSLLLKDYPHMRVIVRKAGSGCKHSATKGLTYKYMRRFIAIMDSKNLQTFDKVLLHHELYETDNSTIYHHVKDWFLSNYPNHKDMILAAEPKAIVSETPIELPESA